MFELPSALCEITDSRKWPEIPTIRIVQAVLLMLLTRSGSLNAIEQFKESSWVREYLGGDLPSADSLGRIWDLVDPDTIRKVIHRIYDCLKRNKVLELPWHGLIVLIVDGHESHATYMRHCDGCLERKIGSGENERTQYYHRNVTGQLVVRDCRFLIDAEPQLPGEDEVACAIRLFERVVTSYPRSFDVVVADALYAKSNFFNKVLEYNKDVMSVLKDDRRDLLKDADSLFADKAPTCVFTSKGTEIECWDADDFQSWPQVTKPVRVVRTRETKKLVRRQLDGELDQQPASSWTWVTTLSMLRAPTSAAVDIGHSRWSIENQGFNELVNHWHADHIYKHDSTAILNFWLMTMMAYNLFRSFFLRNLKPALRKGKTMLHFARLIMTELYSTLPMPDGVPP